MQRRKNPGTLYPPHADDTMELPDDHAREKAVTVVLMLVAIAAVAWRFMDIVGQLRAVGP